MSAVQFFTSLGDRQGVPRRKGYRYNHWEAAELMDFPTHTWQLRVTQTQDPAAALPARGPAHLASTPRAWLFHHC